MPKLFIEDLDLTHKRVLMRVDLDVPIEDGTIRSDDRLRAALPSIRYALAHGASVVLMSHLGRPGGARVAQYSLGPIAERLQLLLGTRVRFVPDCVGPGAERACAGIRPGEVIVLENLRFHAEEEGHAAASAVAAFRASLSRLGDVYVADAFAVAQLAHSSVVGVNLPQRAAGYLMQKELDVLGSVLDAPRRPFVAVVGGADVSGKLDVMQSLLPAVDALLIGGGIAFTFFMVQEKQVGRSLRDEERLDMAWGVLVEAGDKLVLPVDVLVTDALDVAARRVGALKTVASDGIAQHEIGIDVGEAARAGFADVVKRAGTVVWTGPMGVIEIPAAATGTRAMADALVEATARGADTIVGGDDTVAAIEAYGLADKLTHVSAGGAAALQLLARKELPGVACLSEK
jgi:phosphoglycerate kinase